MNWYIEAWKNYANFQGRSQRAAYWYFVLFNLIANLVLGFIDGIAGLSAGGGVGVLSGLYSLAVVIPSIAVGARRLHDTDRSGWWLLLAFIPIVGWIVLLIWAVQDSQPGANRFGSNPKGA
jgi:uncharacterized membrane protein YhaH (DUF805 family)